MFIRTSVHPDTRTNSDNCGVLNDDISGTMAAAAAAAAAGVAVDVDS
jgi:malic enzyme